MRIRSVISKYLQDSGLTASALAQKAGVPKATLMGWCVGKQPRNMEQVKAVARCMGTTLDALLFDEVEPQPVLLDARSFSGFTLDDDGWHRGTLEVRFRPLSGAAKKI